MEVGKALLFLIYLIICYFGAVVVTGRTDYFISITRRFINLNNVKGHAIKYSFLYAQIETKPSPCSH
jgi:hypothetical protein